MIAKRKSVEILPIFYILAKSENRSIQKIVISLLAEVAKMHPNEVLPVLKEWIEDEEVREITRTVINKVER